MQTRTFNFTPANLRETTDGNCWEFDALAVPWDTIDDIGGGIMEQIERGALTPADLGVKLRLEHNTTIGKVIETRDEPDGLYITARISNTTDGRDARTLLLDEALTSLSVGFVPTQSPTITHQGDTTVITQHAGTLMEVSLVSFPAYKATGIKEIRNQQDNQQDKETLSMDNDLTLNLETLERSLTVLSDRVEALATPHDEASPLAEFRSYGQYIKALASGDEVATQAFTGAVSGDDKTNKPAWYARILKRMEGKQRVTNLFKHTYSLPAKGMSLEYPVFGEDTTKVSQQKEGDPLPYGKITTLMETTPIITYGGYSEVSRQQIERGSDLYLSTLFERQCLRYARKIEQATRTLFTDQNNANKTTSPISIAKTATNFTVNDIISILIDAAQYFDDTDVVLKGIAVSGDVLKYLATLDAKPKALKFRSASAGDTNQGTLDAAALEGDLSSIPVHLVPGAGVFSFFAEDAIEIHESAGAPARLQDENVVNLTKAFSVYGYAAHFAPDADALVPVKFTA